MNSLGRIRNFFIVIIDKYKLKYNLITDVLIQIKYINNNLY